MDPFHTLSIAVAVAEFLDFTSAVLDEQKNEAPQTARSPMSQVVGRPVGDLMRLCDTLERLASCGSAVVGGEMVSHERVCVNQHDPYVSAANNISDPERHSARMQWHLSTALQHLSVVESQETWPFQSRTTHQRRQEDGANGG